MTDRPIEYILAMRYAQIVDDREFEKMQEIMSDDFVMSGPGLDFNNLADFVSSLTILNKYSATHHFVGNQLGEWQGDTYRGETYCIAAHIYEEDGVERKLDMGIRYGDTIIKVGDCYKFSERKFNLVWTQDLPTKG